MSTTLFRLRNFKSFKDSGEFEVKPITILIGKNSSGKSSLLKFFLMLKQSVENRDPGTTLILNGRYATLGSFIDLVFGKKHQRILKFDFILKDIKLEDTRYLKMLRNDISIRRKLKYFELSDSEFATIQKTLNEELKSIKSIRASFSFKYKNGLIILSQFELFVNNRRTLEYSFISEEDFIIKAKFLRESKLLEINGFNVFRDGLFINVDVPFEYDPSQLKLFDDVILKEGKERKTFLKYVMLAEFNNEVINFISSRVNNYFERLFYLGPLRESPQRFYISSGESRTDVGLKGEFASDLLFLSKLSQGQRFPVKRLKGSFRFRNMQDFVHLDKNLLDKVNYWLEAFGISGQIDFESIKGNYFQLFVKDKTNNININVADTGFGVSQILPVIVEGFYSPNNSQIIIEQPEIHLHPSAQSQLADLFIDIVNPADLSKSIMIETHSEHLILRLRRRIAEGKLASDNIAIYFTDYSAGQTKLKRINIDEYGDVKNWPKDFFSQDFFETLEISKTIAKRKSQEKK
jgi:predicted ATPase